MNEQVHPFSERDSVFADESIGRLSSSPEVQASGVEVIELQKLASRLYEGPERPDGSQQSLEAVNEISIEAASKTFYLDYFHTNDGRAELARLGITSGSGSMDSMATLCIGVAQGTALSPKDRRELATASRDWYLDTLTQNLLSNTPDELWQDSSTFIVNFEPDKLLTKFEALQQFRAYYRTVSRELREGSTDPDGTQRQLLAIYASKVNSMVAGLYPNVLGLAKQLSMSPETERTKDWQVRLFAAAPTIRHLYGAETKENTERQDDLLRRLDMIRNGTEATNTHTFSAISAADRILAEEIDSITEESVAAGIEKLPQEVIAELEAQTWTSTELRRLLETALATWGLLSGEIAGEDEVDGRHGAASDNGWQILVSSKVKSLSVNGVKRVMKVPKSFGQDGVKSLAVGAHELTHVLQCESDIETAKSVPLARIKGRRVQAGREMGGIYEERRVYAMCGQSRPVSTAYLRALQVKEAGGNQLDGAKAYLQATMNGAPLTPEATKKAQIASDRMLRLYRQGGYDSQALDYLEQELLLRSMSNLPQSDVRAIASSAMSFSLKDAATLHDLGLLQLPKAEQVRTPAEDVVQIYLSNRTA